MTETNNINIQKEEPDLYKRSIKGGYWVFALQISTQLLGFLKSIIIWNLLLSHNLKVVVIANLVMAGLYTFSESGFQAALVQKKENIADYLDTAWVIGILRGIFLFLIIFFAAPFFASLLATQELVPLAVSVMRAMGCCFLIRAFQNVGVIYFQKEMQFNKTFGLTMAGTLTDIVLSITLVLIYQNVWAIVIASLVSATINLLMSYLLCSYRPRFHFIPEKARELWKFGKWLFGSNIIRYLLNEGDDWFVGFYLGADFLTLYRYAYRFANMPATYITSTISQVSFPAYSKIQHDVPRLRQAYLKVLKVTATASFPVAFLVFILGPDFVRLFLVEESQAMIVPLQIIALQGLLRSEGATRGPLLNAMGQPRLRLFYQCLRLCLLVILLYPLTKIWGITGTALSTVLVTLLVKPLGFLKSCRLLKCSARCLLEPSIYPLISAFVMAASVACSRSLLCPHVTRPTFFLLIFISGIVYLGVLYLLDRYSEKGYRRLLREQINRGSH
ncbi:MAG: lipopolysaccharide biosynthesis protein [Deltaproteobacteria bacterium]|nr:lipopolysaccharide biosynthesis protein [Deltaproteobacteria bacterium]